MHKALEGATPEIRGAFHAVAVEIIKQVHDQITEENLSKDNLNEFARFACERWIEENKDKFPLPYTPEMRELFIEIISDVLFFAYLKDFERQ